MKTDYSYHYRKWQAEDSPATRAYMLRYYTRMLAGYLPVEKSARLLDVGCGAGLLLGALQDLGYTEAQGVDSDEGQVRACHAKGLKAVLSNDTRQFLRDRQDQFDRVFVIDVVEHIAIADQMEFVAALASALKPEGSLVCRVPNANSTLAGRYRYIDFTHCCSFTEHSLDFLLHHAGFHQIQIQGVEYFSRVPWWRLPSPRHRYVWLLYLVRAWRRLEMIAELGPQQGRAVPLSPNLLAVAHKP